MAVTAARVEQAGVDTWRVAWYVDEESAAARALTSLCDRPSARGSTMGQKIEGHTLGWIPGHRMVWAEGHPGAIGELNPEESHQLGHGAALPAAAAQLAQTIEDFGVPLSKSLKRDWAVGGGEIGCFRPVAQRPAVRRMDVTCDLAFDTPAEGLATLSGVAGAIVPRVKTEPVYEAGGRRLETVMLRGYGGRKIIGRWYDKGYERSGRNDDRGRLIRPEDQRRFTRETSRFVDDIDARYVRESFTRRFKSLWQATRGIKVGTPLQLAARLLELQEAGEVTPGQAKSIAGHLVLEQANAHRQSRAQRYRDRAAARKLGLVLADGALEEVEIDLGDVMEQALEAEAWGADS